MVGGWRRATRSSRREAARPAREQPKVRSGLEVLRCERSARVRFEVYLERSCFAARAKCNGDFDEPGFVPRRVGKLTGVMSLEASIEIVGQTGVVASCIRLADKDVDVVKGCHSMISIDGVDRLAGSGFVFDYAGTGFVRNCLVSALACQGVVRNAVSNEAWWSRTGSNRRPPECHSGALPTELRPHRDGISSKRRGLMSTSAECGGASNPASEI